MAIIDKLTAIADGFRTSRETSDKYTLEEMAALAAEPIGGGDIDAFIEGSLTEVTSNASSIRTNAFQGITTLTTASLPAATNVNPYAFSGCSALESANLPSATTIGVGVFDNCKKLKSVNLQSATTLADYALRYATPLESVDLPSVTYLGTEAFAWCSKLKSVNLPVLQTTGNNVFYNCSSLETIEFPMLKTLSMTTFQSCGAFKTLILRKSDGVCTLKGINASSGTPFASGGTGGTVYVPQALIESYKVETNWSALYGAGTCNFVAIEGSEYE